MGSSRDVRWDRKSRISKLYPRCGGDMDARFSARKTRSEVKKWSYCFTHPHIQSFSFVPFCSRKFPAFRIFSQRVLIGFWMCEVVHFVRVAISRIPASCCCNVLISRGESHVATYQHIRIVCITQELLAVVTWWKRKLVCSFSSLSWHVLRSWYQNLLKR